MAASSEAPPIVSRSRNPRSTCRGKPDDRDDERDEGGAQREATPPLEGGDVERRGRAHGCRPRMLSTEGATRASAGAWKNGIGATPAMPAMREPGKIWMAVFS